MSQIPLTLPYVVAHIAFAALLSALVTLCVQALLQKRADKRYITALFSSGLIQWIECKQLDGSRSMYFFAGCDGNSARIHPPKWVRGPDPKIGLHIRYLFCQFDEDRLFKAVFELGDEIGFTLTNDVVKDFGADATVWSLTYEKPRENPALAFVAALKS